MNKKGQGGSVIGIWVGQLILFSLVVFGLIQVIAFAFPGGGAAVDDFVATYFKGSFLLFLFIAAGMIGMGINELLERLAIGIKPLFSKRLAAFLIIGVLVVLIGFGIGYAGEAGLIEHSMVQSMILP